MVHIFQAILSGPLPPGRTIQSSAVRIWIIRYSIFSIIELAVTFSRMKRMFSSGHHLLSYRRGDIHIHLSHLINITPPTFHEGVPCFGLLPPCVSYPGCWDTITPFYYLLGQDGLSLVETLKCAKFTLEHLFQCSIVSWPPPRRRPVPNPSHGIQAHRMIARMRCLLIRTSPQGDIPCYHRDFRDFTPSKAHFALLWEGF